MIYTILAIPFGAAALYNYTAKTIARDCFRELTEEEIESFNLTKEEAKDAKVFDNKSAGWRLAIMAVSYYPAYPVLMLQKWFTS